MHLILLWRHVDGDGGATKADTVAANLQRIFAPLFRMPPAQRVLQGPGVSGVVLEQPAPGWRPVTFYEDERGWALAVDYAVNGPRMLGASTGEGDSLPALCRRLQADPLPMTRELAPPFCFVWSDGAGETFVQNDGLGLSQMFEFRDGQRWALSNKLFAFRALGLPIEPDAEEWAVRATLGWFPLDLTGYRRIRTVGPATQFRISARGVARAQFDVLADWISPRGLSPRDCLELARVSLLELLAGCVPLWDRPEAGLTGGWDSRAVAATLRALGADFSPVVRGLPGRHDVVIATELARIAGLELKVQGSGGLPPGDADACRRCIERALVWQAGHAATHRHKTFLADRPGLRPKHVSVTGQHGEIARRERALFADGRAEGARAAELTERQYEEFTVQELLSDIPPFLKPSLREVVQEAVLASYHQADRYGLTGRARTDFFCLYEFTRRKGAGVHSWQPRQIIAPFLSPAFIRAVFGWPGRTDANAFHRHIIRAGAPDWADVPYFEDLEAARGGGSDAGWRQPRGRENYDGALYWESIGRPIIDEAFAEGGFWTEVFDPDLVAAHWRAAPDILAVLHLLPKAISDV